MQVIVCCKVVPEEQDITVAADRSLSVDKAESKISQYDLNAVEAGAALAASSKAVVTALSVGGKRLENTKVRKDILSRGPESLTVVMDEALESALPHESAKALACAAKKLGFDLILCGEGSGDLYQQQVGLILGAMLNVPTINAVSKVTPQEGSVLVERTLESEVEVLEIPFPAVLCLSTDINTPSIPGMKAILAAGKKPVTAWTVADIGFSTETPVASFASVRAPENVERKRIVLEGDSDENIAALADHLRAVLR